MPSTGPLLSVAPLRRRALAVLGASVLALGAPAWAPPVAAQARSVAAPPDHTDDWGWPVEGTWGPPEVLRGFDPPDQSWLPGHRGVDLGAEPYALVRAAGTGVVVFAGRLAGRGVVSIEHPGGLRTTYEPVEASVVEGQLVELGEIVGTLEPLTTHCARACLHWGLKRAEVYLDPLSLLGTVEPVLLPYGPPVARSSGRPQGGWPW